MTRTAPAVLLAIIMIASTAPAYAEQSTDSPRNVRFEGAPRIGSTDGWSLKPRGRLQYDVGHVSRPEGVTVAGLGTADEIRRAQLGVEGTMPGGFSYQFELELSEAVNEITEAMISYKASDALTLTVGQHKNFRSLDEMTSDRLTSFMERAAFTDAFNFERQVGLSATWKHGPVTVQLGIFTDNLLEIDEADDAVSVDGRVIYAPQLGGGQLHLGGSIHWRDTGDRVARGITTRYRQRPQIHTTDVRFLATPALPVGTETSFGLEAAWIRGPFHATGEAHWFNADTATPGVGPTFFGAYAEVGWFLTGETRAYRSGRWDATRVRRAVEEGGSGAFQVVLRYDHLDLNSGTVRGGRQHAVLAGLNWTPTDYVRFMVNVGRVFFDDSPIPAAGGDRNYAVTVAGFRAGLDF